jgi:hypothetical protein
MLYLSTVPSAYWSLRLLCERIPYAGGFPVRWKGFVLSSAELSLVDYATSSECHEDSIRRWLVMGSVDKWHFVLSARVCVCVCVCGCVGMLCARVYRHPLISVSAAQDSVNDCREGCCWSLWQAWVSMSAFLVDSMWFVQGIHVQLRCADDFAAIRIWGLQIVMSTSLC